MRWRRWGLWLGLPLLALAVLVAVFRWDWLIPLVEPRVSAAAGRPVDIGHLHVSLGRVITVTVDEVRVGNPAGFPEEPPFAAVPRATIALEAWPLLRDRRLVVPSITLDRPALTVLERDDGSHNYGFGTGAEPGEAGEGPRIGELRILDGTAHVALSSLKADFRVALATEHPPGEEPQVVAEAEGTYAGEPITGRLRGGAILNLRNAATPWPIDLTLANGPSEVALRGTVQEPLALQGADLRLDLKGPDMAMLAPLVGVPIPQTPPYLATGRLDYAGSAFRFTDVEGQLGNSDFAGRFSVTPGGERPVLDAEVTSRRVDLVDLGGFLGGTPGRIGTPGQTTAQREALERRQADPRLLPNQPINIPALRAADIHLRYRAEDIRGQGMPFDSLAVTLDIEDGTIRLHPVQFGVGRGSIGGDFVLVPQEGGALQAKGELELRRVDVSRLLRAAGAGGSGTLGGTGRIEGTGRSLSELLGRGNGELTVVMVGGNVSSLLMDLSGLQFGKALLSALGLPDRSSIECLIGDFGLRRGSLTTRTLLLDTESHLVTGAGTAHLGRETLDFRIKTESKRPSVGSLPTPIAITGSFKDPSVQPEVGELAARAGAAVGLGVLFAPLALLPTIQLGVGENSACENLTRRSR